MTNDPRLHAFGRRPVQLEFGTFHRMLDSGNHHPLLFSMEEAGRGPAGQWVVKPSAVVSMVNRHEQTCLLAELIGSDLSAFLSLSTPAVGLVRFPEDASSIDLSGHDTMTRKEVEQVIALNQGREAFCCRHLEGAIDLHPRILRKKQKILEQVRTNGPRMMLLDQFLMHDDRTPRNPNALWWFGQMVTIDHGAALARIMQSSSGTALAQQTALPDDKLRTHLLFDALRRRSSEISFAEAAKRLASLTDNDIAQMAQNWPQSMDVSTSRGGGMLIDELVAFLKERRSQAAVLASAAARVIGGKS